MAHSRSRNLQRSSDSTSTPLRWASRSIAMIRSAYWWSWPVSDGCDSAVYACSSWARFADLATRETTLAALGSAPWACEIPSSTDLRCFSFCFILSHNCSVSSADFGASDSVATASSGMNTCGWRVMSLSTKRSHTSSMPNGSVSSCAHTCAWNTDCRSISPSSSRMFSRSSVSTASMYS